MGDVLRLPLAGQPRSSSSASRVVAIDVEQLRAIDRDVRHLEAVTTRARDAEKLADLIAEALGLHPWQCEPAARAIGLYVTTGKIRTAP